MLERKRTKDLPKLSIVMDKINNLYAEFNPTFYYDSEAFLEKLLKMGKKLRRKEKTRQKRHKKIYAIAKPLRF